MEEERAALEAVSHLRYEVQVAFRLIEVRSVFARDAAHAVDLVLKQNMGSQLRSYGPELIGSIVREMGSGASNQNMFDVMAASMARQEQGGNGGPQGASPLLDATGKPMVYNEQEGQEVPPEEPVS